MLAIQRWANPNSLPAPLLMLRPSFPLVAASLVLAILCACCNSTQTSILQNDPLWHQHDRSYLHGYPALHPDGLVNMVVEIPTGTTGKWEVTKPEGELRWEIRDGEPRVVQYLGYPGNYGMIPRTLLPEEQGGDGDPLDVLVLGDAVPRGTVLPVRIIGVMEMIDDGEQDDKLVAVRAGTPFEDVHSVAQLRQQFGGVEAIVKSWFANYKGPGEITVKNFREADEAQAILEAAIAAYEASKR